MKRFYLLLVLGLLPLVYMGCAGISRELEFTDTSSHAFVFGYLDVDKSPCHLDYIEYKQLAPAIEKPYYYMRIDNGAFYREDLVTPGSFQLYQYGGSPKSLFTNVSQYNIEFPDQGYTFSLQQPGRLYYIGSYRVFEEGGLFSSKTYLERIDHPNQLEVLQMILPDAKGSPWEQIILNTIRILGGRPVQ
jgi:hypothetical protein